MRNDSVLYRVLHVGHDAKCFFAVFILASSSATIRQLYAITKLLTYESNEYKKGGSGTGLNRKQGLVETDT